ncbi:MAG: CIA30 family protein [Campylobacterota bacterium]|nr:CIA30 family protein [Campylobacterota bacterium]
MRYVYIVLFSIFTLVIAGCNSNMNPITPFGKSKEVYGFSFIDAKVLETFGDKVIVEIEEKDIVTGDSYEDKLINKVIKSSLFIVGMDTFIGKEKAYISDIRDRQITFTINNTKLQKDQDIKIYIPKKTIAVMDFSLIGMKSSTIEKFALEDMITKLVQSGQYIVVERSKLDTILNEQKLADSGLLDEQSASKVGKLVSADIILTGTFSKRRNSWNVNLRLVDVTTGIIISAINEKIGIKQFRPKQSKDTSNFTEDFEDMNFNKGWITKLINKNGSKSKYKIDNTTGANNTNSSYRINYLLKKDKSMAVFLNKRLRDISGFNGIKLYAKSTSSTTLTVTLHDQNFNDSHNNKWLNPISIDQDWRKYEIPFDEFIIAKGHARDKPGGDGVLDLDNIEKIGFGLVGKLNTKNEKSTIWIDEISFY